MVADAARRVPTFKLPNSQKTTIVFTPPLLHSFTPSLLHSFTPPLLHSSKTIVQTPKLPNSQIKP